MNTPSWSEPAYVRRACLATLIACVLIVLGSCLCACASSTEHISIEAQKVQQLTAATKIHVKTILDECDAFQGESSLVKIRTEANAIVPLQDQIHTRAGAVLKEVPHVQDKTPWWAGLLNKSLWVILILLVAGGGLYLGVWPFIRMGLAFVWSFVPTGLKTRAKFDAEAIVNDTATPDQREAIAAHRTASPVFNAAFTRIKNQLKKL